MSDSDDDYMHWSESASEVLRRYGEDRDAMNRHYRKYFDDSRNRSMLRRDKMNLYYRDQLPPSVKNELMEFAYQDAKASGNDRLARAINKDGALKYDALVSVPRGRYLKDMSYGAGPVSQTLFELSLEDKYGSGQEEARRIADELKRKGEKSAGFGATFEILEEISEDPFGAAAKYAVKVGE